MWMSLPDHRELDLGHVRDHGAAALGREQRVVPRHLHHVGVARHDPEAALVELEAPGKLLASRPALVPIHRRVVAQPGVEAVRNTRLEGRRVEQIDVRCRHAASSRAIMTLDRGLGVNDSGS